MKPAERIWWSCGSGHVELRLTKADADSACHPGPCDSDVAALARVPYVANQLAEVDETDAAACVREMFADIEPAELADHMANLHRILWLAAADISEGNT
jgi:hypothetical protein